MLMFECLWSDALDGASVLWLTASAAGEPPSGRPAVVSDANLPGEKLGALFFEDQFGLAGGLFFFAVGAGYVTEGRGRGIGRTKLPERAFALGVSVGSAADQRSLAGHGMLLGVQGVAGRLDNLRLVGKNGDSGLSEGGRGTKNKQNNECGFHRCFGPEFTMGWCNLDTNLRGLGLFDLRGGAGAWRKILHI